MIPGACVAIGSAVAHLTRRLEFRIADGMRGVRSEYVVYVAIEVIADADDF